MPAWRARLDRSERASRSAAAASRQSRSRSSGRTRSHSSSRGANDSVSSGPPLSLSEMRSPSPLRRGDTAAATRSRPHTAHTQRLPRSPPTPPPEGPFEYDLYPSPAKQQQQREYARTRRPSPFRAERLEHERQQQQRARNSFYPDDAAAVLAATRYANATAEAAARRRAAATPPQRSPSSSYTVADLDIPATQRRIRSLMSQSMDEHNARSVASLSAAASRAAATQRLPPSYPLTAAVRIAQQVRSIEELKRDVALQMADHSHPAHRLNHPRQIDEGSIMSLAASTSAAARSLAHSPVPAASGGHALGVFHLSHHSSASMSASTGVSSARLGASSVHPLPADGGDRRVKSILSTASPASALLTQTQLRANTVSRHGGSSGTHAHEEKEQHPAPSTTASKAPVSFFPVDDTPAESSALSSQAPSAYLATMRAGALRVEHLLRQPHMQSMLDAVLPVELSREAIEARPASPPRNGSHVDRLLYDTITGREQRREFTADTPTSSNAGDGARVDAAPPPPHSLASRLGDSGSLSPPASSFCRSSLLQREARLDALLALSSAAEDDEAVRRMRPDPLADALLRAERERPPSFYDAAGVLESEAGAPLRPDESVARAREVLVEGPRAAMAQVPEGMSNVDAVLAELMGQMTSPSPSSASASASSGASTTKPGPSSSPPARQGHSELEETQMHPGALSPALRRSADEVASAASLGSPSSPALAPPSSATSAFAFVFAPSPSPTFSDMSIQSAPQPIDATTLHSPATVHYGGQELQLEDTLVAPGPYPADSDTTIPPELRISADELEYLQASTSLAPFIRQIEMEDLYTRSLEERAAQFDFVRGQHEMRSLWAHWVGALASARERDEVLMLKRHEGDTGYRHFQKQQQQQQQQQQHSRLETTPAPASSSSPSTLVVAPLDAPSVSSPSPTASASASAASSKRDLLASIHASHSLARRSFRAWMARARMQALGRRMCARAVHTHRQTLFRNWRDLTRIVRGEFDRWVQEKSRDAQRDHEEAQERQGEHQDWEQRRRQEVGVGREVGPDEPLYARSSSTAMSAARRRSPSSRAPNAPHTSTTSTTDPLVAALSSSYTRDQFAAHQQQVLQSRRNEEEMRQYFADLRRQVQANRNGGEGSRTALVGPLLFQQASSIQRPAFVLEQQQKQQQQQAHASSLPPPLSSPVRMKSGAVLHEMTGAPSLDRDLMRVHRDRSELRLEHLSSASPPVATASSSGRGRSFSPVGGSASPPSRSSRSSDPLRPPAWLTTRPHRDVSLSPPRRKADGTMAPSVASSHTAEPMSPVRARGGGGNAAEDMRRSSSSPSAMGAAHGVLPGEFAPVTMREIAPATVPTSSPKAAGRGVAYWQSSHWQAPAPSSISDEELRANIAIAAAMRRELTEPRQQQDTDAQWRRVEQEKELYRRRIMQQHEPAAV